MADRKQGAGLSSGSSAAVHKTHTAFFFSLGYQDSSSLPQ